jgi:ribosomal-protein-alanine N-acetyltransferase
MKPSRKDLISASARAAQPASQPTAAGGRQTTASSWTAVAPTLQSPRLTLRGLLSADAESLFSLLTTEPVGQFILPPPDSVERFERFIQWTHYQQQGGRQLCLGIVPAGHDASVGLIQVRRETSDASTAEWGFALSERFWGTGLFVGSAELLLAFLFEAAGIYRLEARTIVDNARANGALRKLGAVKEGRLRRGFHRDREHVDQYLWSILADEWLSSRPITPRVAA